MRTARLPSYSFMLEWLHGDYDDFVQSDLIVFDIERDDAAPRQNKSTAT